jgi:Metallo-peptidase family M12/Reprolysin family propeptide
MSIRKLRTAYVALACFFSGMVSAAPTFKILYQERADIAQRGQPSGQQHLSFDAYGHHFEIELQPNIGIARGLPPTRTDIKPYEGTVTGQPGSWVRLTQTREGWRGVLSDGQALYAIEPASEVAKSAVQPLPTDTSGSSPVIYRLADAIMPEGAAYCGTGANETPAADATDRSTALKAFTRLSEELVTNGSAQLPRRELTVGIVADHTFSDAVGADPLGAIVARMDIVDGIWSSQVGIRVVLGPVTILSDNAELFSSTTVPGDLLAEVSSYRARLSAHTNTGLTHLMTGRTMQGNIIGISYLGAVCQGASAVSLSQSTISTSMGGLIAAHELGHSFNAVHDGVPGVCATTPQTYLMAPIINFNDQFSSCSLNQIEARAVTAQCLVQIPPSAGGSLGPATSNTGSDGGSSVGSAPTGGGGRLDLGWLVCLAGILGLRWARPLASDTRPPAAGCHRRCC